MRLEIQHYTCDNKLKEEYELHFNRYDDFKLDKEELQLLFSSSRFDSYIDWSQYDTLNLFTVKGNSRSESLVIRCYEGKGLEPIFDFVWEFLES